MLRSGVVALRGRTCFGWFKSLISVQSTGVKSVNGGAAQSHLITTTEHLQVTGKKKKKFKF